MEKQEPGETWYKAIPLNQSTLGFLLKKRLLLKTCFFVKTCFLVKTWFWVKKWFLVKTCLKKRKHGFSENMVCGEKIVSVKTCFL